MERIQLPSLKTELKTCLGNLEATQSLLSKASTSITFFGSRIVTIQGYKGFCPLNTLMMNALKAAQEKRDLNNITLKERAFGTLIQDRLISFYDDSDAKLKEHNLFTRICCYVRDFFSTISISAFGSRIVPRDYLYSYRSDIQATDTLDGCFRGYPSRDQFINVFGDARDPLLFVHASYEGGGWVFAKAKSIMDKARSTYPELANTWNLVNKP